MSVEANKRVVQRLFNEDLSESDPARRAVVAAEIFAPDFFDPTNPPGMQHGLDGHIAIVNLFASSFPGMRWTIDELIAEGDTVVALTTMAGAHTGDFFGIPPSGRVVTVSGIHVLTLRDGRIILHRGVNDDLGMMRQLGVIPEMSVA